MKLGPVTKLDKRNTATSKNLTMTLCRKIVTSLSFFRFLANLEQQEISNTGLILLLCVKVLFLTKNPFLQRNADISKIKGVFVLKSKFF